MSWRTREGVLSSNPHDLVLRYTLVTLLSLGFVFMSLSAAYSQEEPEEVPVPGQILIRFDPSVIGELKINLDTDGFVTTGLGELDELGKEFNLVAMSPVFKDPQLEPDTGVILSSYYALTFRADTDVFAASKAFGTAKSVQIAHPVPVAVIDPQLEEIVHEIDPDLQKEPEQNLPPDRISYLPNQLILVFQLEALEKLVLQTDPETKLVLTGIDELDQANRKFGIIAMDRVFPDARFEEKVGVTLRIYYYARSQFETFDDFGGMQAVLEEYQASGALSTAHEVPILIDDVTRPNDYFVDINGDGVSSAGTSVSAPANLMREQWSLELIRAYDAWDITRGANVTIAINDSGVDVTHPDLTGNILRNSAGAVIGDTSVHGNHGTSVAGIAAAVGDNSIGVAGVAYESDIMPLDREYDPSISWVIGGVRNIQRGTDLGADVINMSWHFEATSTFSTTAFDWLEAAIAYASASDVVLVCSAGNNPYSWTLSLPYASWPALYDQTTYVDPVTGASIPMTVISTGNVSETDTRWGTSNYGEWLDIMAPGAHTTSTDRIGSNGYNTSATMPDYAEFGGTSSASPHVAGAAALLLSIDPSLTPNDIRTTLINSADKIGGVVYDATGFNQFYGFGRLNLHRALQEHTPDVAIRPWNSHWNSPDIWVDNDADGVEDSPQKGRINTLYAGFRNQGSENASNFNVRFEFKPIGIGNPFQLIGTVNYPGTLTPGSSDSVSIAWDLPDIPTYAGVDHFCVKVIITDVVHDSDLSNNSAQNNFFDVGTWEPGGDFTFRFFLGNPYEYLLHPTLRIEMPKGWELIFDGDVDLQELVLKQGEVRPISGTVIIPSTADKAKDGVVSFAAYDQMKGLMGGVAFLFRGDIKATSQPGYKLALDQGINLMSVPLDPGVNWRLSDLAKFIGPEVNFIVWYDKINDIFVSYFADFPLDSPANKQVLGGDGYITVMSKPKDVTFTGKAWSNTTVPLAPTLATSGSALVLDGYLASETSTDGLQGIQIVLENLRTHEVVRGITGEFGVPGRYTLTLADNTGRAVAQAGDTFRITVLDAHDQMIVEHTHRVSGIELAAGLLNLHQIQISLVPNQTELLANYPNPFNPETWIPFRLSATANVSVDIYNASGQTVRTLHLGHREAGNYLNRARSAHWDGQNQYGEQVASGTYFYVLRAGDFTATRRMIVLK